MPKKLVVDESPKLIEAKIMNSDDIRELIIDTCLKLGYTPKQNEWVPNQCLVLPEEKKLITQLNFSLHCLNELDQIEHSKRISINYNQFAKPICMPPTFNANALSIHDIHHIMYWNGIIEENLSGLIYDLQITEARLRSEKALFNEFYAGCLFNRLMTSPAAASLPRSLIVTLDKQGSLYDKLQVVKKFLDSPVFFLKLFRQPSIAENLHSTVKKQPSLALANIRPELIDSLSTEKDRMLCALHYLTDDTISLDAKKITQRINECLMYLFQGPDQEEKIQAILVNADREAQGLKSSLSTTQYTA